MTIDIGEAIPVVRLTTKMDGGIRQITTRELCAGKKVVLVGVPGAFTPTCSDEHMPGFLENAAEIRARGVDTIACVSVNDIFVMDAWAKNLGISQEILMLADGNGDLARAMGLEADFSAFGMGKRFERFAAVLEDGVVQTLNVETPGRLEVSTAEAVLEAL